MKKRGLVTEEKGARIFYTERRERETENKQGQKGVRLDRVIFDELVAHPQITK